MQFATMITHVRDQRSPSVGFPDCNLAFWAGLLDGCHGVLFHRQGVKSGGRRICEEEHYRVRDFLVMTVTPRKIW